MQQPKFDVAVVGAGIIGCSIAFELTRIGKSVLVIERPVSGQATWAAAGILPDIGDATQTDVYEQFRQHANAKLKQWSAILARDTTLDNQYWQCGSIYCSDSLTESASIEGFASELRENGILHHWLTRVELQQQYPSFAPSLSTNLSERFLHVPNDAQLDNRVFLDALKQFITNHGAQFVSCTNGLHLNIDRPGCAQVLIDSHRASADFVCVCAGAWSKEILDPLGIHMSLTPVRGQMIVFKPGRFVLNKMIQKNGRYLVPRRDGRILAGSTIEQVGFNANTTQTQLSSLCRFANGIFPELQQNCIVDSWAGLRPAIAQTVPFIDFAGGFSNLLISTGHFRNGIQLSAITAEMAVEKMYPGHSNTPELFEWNTDSLLHRSS